jgi:hypothetical protein
MNISMVAAIRPANTIPILLRELFEAEKLNDSRIKVGVDSTDTIQGRPSRDNRGTITRLCVRPPGPIYSNFFQAD